MDGAYPYAGKKYFFAFNMPFLRVLGTAPPEHTALSGRLGKACFTE